MLFVSKCNVDQWFSNTQVFLGPAASVSVGNLLDMHILWVTPWYNEQKQMGTQQSVFHKPSSVFWRTLKFRNLWSRLHEFCEWQHKRHKLSESFGCLRLLYVVPKQTLKNYSKPRWLVFFIRKMQEILKIYWCEGIFLRDGIPGLAGHCVHFIDLRNSSVNFRNSSWLGSNKLVDSTVLGEPEWISGIIVVLGLSSTRF